MKVNGVLLILVLGLVGCARSPLKNRHEALRPITKKIQLYDDMEWQGFSEALQANIQHLKSKPNHELQFGSLVLSSAEYLRSLESLLKVANEAPEKLSEYLNANFQTFEVYGQDDWGQAFITSYYEPVLDGSEQATDEFSQPLYGVPDDMVIVRLDQFSKALGANFHQRFCKTSQGCVPKKKLGILRAKIIKTKARSAEIVPYPQRSEIDQATDKIKAPILAWVRPLDAFVLQIQGSGTVLLGNQRELKLGYAGQNGRSYQAIGKYLFDVIPKNKMSLQRIEAHVKTLSKKDQQDLFNKNPSYVFFKTIETKPVTYFGIETIEGRTIATDKRYFPKGALGFLQFKKPIFSSEKDLDPSAWKKTSRFVFDHDTGGAIKGGGRLDLFWGKGKLAKRSAGVMRQTGRLYYLAPKAPLKIKLN